MQAEIVDDVNAHTDKAIEAFAKKAQENNQSPFSPENVNKLDSNHEYEKLNTLSKQFQKSTGYTTSIVSILSIYSISRI